MPRRRIPTAVKKARGNPGKRSLPKNEPVPTLAISKEPPSWLTEPQAAEWKAAVTNAHPGHLSSLDGNVLATYCVAMTVYREAAEKISQAGILAKGADQRVIVSPLVKVLEASGAQLLRAAAELGFTPASRSKVEVAHLGSGAGSGGQAKPSNRFAALRLVKG